MGYKTILADPPWETSAGPTMGEYKKVGGKQVWHTACSKSRPLAYPTMKVQEIAALPVADLCDKNAHLYMWVTNSHLLQAEKIINAWGFNYSTTLVWAKNPMGGGLGGTFRISTEFLIFARRGTLAAKETTVGTWFNVKRDYVNGAPKHSKKPDFFYNLIEQTSPGPYLEMFARNQREGWDVFGNEVANSITLTPNQ